MIRVYPSFQDHCDGTFDALCDHSRFYGNISAILTAGGGQEALDFMRIYWKDYKGQDDQFWEHEWNSEFVAPRGRPPLTPKYVEQSTALAFLPWRLPAMVLPILHNLKLLHSSTRLVRITHSRSLSRRRCRS